MMAMTYHTNYYDVIDMTINSILITDLTTVTQLNKFH